MEHVFKPLIDKIDLGFFNIQLYAICILVGVLVGTWLGYQEIKKFNLKQEDLSDGLVYGFIFGILGARLYYVIYEWDNYKDNIISALYIWEGGLAIHGGIIATAIFIYYFTKKRQMDIFKVLEVVVPGFLLAQAFGRWGNFFNQEAHGGVVPGATLDLKRDFLSNTLHLPQFIVDQMYLYGPNGLNYYHPTFFYEMTWNLLGFLIMYFVLRKIKKYWVGECLSFYLVWYSVGRFFIEGMRTDSLMLGSFRVAQLISIVLAIVGIIWFAYRRYKRIFPVSYIEEVERNKDEQTVLVAKNSTEDQSMEEK